MTTSTTSQRTAWDKPKCSIAIELQRNTKLARTHKHSQYFHITPAGSHYRSQCIAKAAI